MGYHSISTQLYLHDKEKHADLNGILKRTLGINQVLFDLLVRRFEP